MSKGKEGESVQSGFPCHKTEQSESTIKFSKLNILLVKFARLLGYNRHSTGANQKKKKKDSPNNSNQPIILLPPLEQLGPVSFQSTMDI